MMPVLNPLKRPPGPGGRLFVPNIKKVEVKETTDSSSSNASAAPVQSNETVKIIASSSSQAQVNSVASKNLSVESIVPFQRVESVAPPKPALPPKFAVKIPQKATEIQSPSNSFQNDSSKISAQKIPGDNKISRVKRSAHSHPDSDDGDDVVVDAVPKRTATKRQRTEKSTDFDSVASPKSSSVKPRSRAKAVASIFPTSYGTIENFQRITLYSKRSPDGLPGIIFENVDNRAVLHGFEEDYANPNGLRAGDVVASVNSLDARYAKYDQVIAALTTVTVPPSSANGIALRNKVSDDIVCVVFARPTLIPPNAMASAAQSPAAVGTKRVSLLEKIRASQVTDAC